MHQIEFESSETSRNQEVGPTLNHFWLGVGIWKI